MVDVDIFCFLIGSSCGLSISSKLTGNAFLNQAGNFLSISTEEIFVYGVVVMRCVRDVCPVDTFE